MLDMRKGVCALCNHPEVIDAPAMEHLDEDNATHLAVTHVPASLDFLHPRDRTENPRGLLRMLVCRSCGFVQWFASAPERIPIDESDGAKLIVPG